MRSLLLTFLICLQTTVTLRAEDPAGTLADLMRKRLTPELQAAVPEISAEDNAYGIFLLAVESFTKFDGDDDEREILRKTTGSRGIYPAAGQERELLDAYLDDNEESLSLIAKAVEKPWVSKPEFIGKKEPVAARITDFQRLVELHGKRALTDGHLVTALGDAHILIRMGDQRRSRFGDMQFMIRALLTTSAARNALLVARHPEMTPDLVSNLIAAIERSGEVALKPVLTQLISECWIHTLAQQPTDGASLVKGLRANVEAMQNLLKTLREENPAVGRELSDLEPLFTLITDRAVVLDREATADLFQNWFNEVVLPQEPTSLSTYSQCFDTVTRRTLAETVGESGKLLTTGMDLITDHMIASIKKKNEPMDLGWVEDAKRLLSETSNPLGLMIARLQIDGVPFVTEQVLESTTWRRLTLTALHVRRYQLLNGRWPLTLEEAAVPLAIRLDPVSGHDLRFDPDREMVWADWKDGANDQGAPGKDRAVHLVKDPPPAKPAKQAPTIP